MYGCTALRVESGRDGDELSPQGSVEIVIGFFPLSFFQGPRRTSGTTTMRSPAAGGTQTGSSTTRSHSGSYTRWRGGSEEHSARFPVTNSKNNSPENILFLPSFRIHSPPPPIWSKKQFWRILTFAQLFPPTYSVSFYLLVGMKTHISNQSQALMQYLCNTTNCKRFISPSYQLTI